MAELDQQPITLPVHIRVGDGEPWHLGDVTVGVTAELDPHRPGFARLLLQHDGADRVTAQLADLLDTTARQMRTNKAHNTEGTDDAAPHPR